MKKVKIFLASSIEDLKYDRLEVGDFFQQLNEIYLDSGIHFSLVKCEDYDNAIVTGGKQKEYDREIVESELVFFLFFRKVGDYTKHEFEVAIEAFRKNTKPKIVTYFKYVNSIDEANTEVKSFMQLLDGELKHYYNTYGNIDTLKLGILMQIKIMSLDKSELKIQDGAMILNGRSLVNTKNVPILSGNKTLTELTNKKCELQALLAECRATYLADPSIENEERFFNASAELNKVSNRLTEIEKQTMEFMSTIVQITSDGKVITCRQREAIKYFNAGDYDAAQDVLSDAERENELERAENRAATAKNEIQGYVNEDVLWIETEKARGVTAKSAVEIISKYEKIVELVEKHDLDKVVLFYYAFFLYMQKDYAAAIKIAEKLEWYNSAPGVSVAEEHRAKLYYLLGLLYDYTQRYSESEEFYGKAIDEYTRLAERDPESYELDLAVSYNDLGKMYLKIQRYEEAEDLLEKAIEYMRLSELNPDLYDSCLATTCNNLGRMYHITQHYEEAEELLIEVVEMYKCLAEDNSTLYEPRLSVSYNNLGMLYQDTQRFEEANEAYCKALEIRKRLADRNPDAYEPDLASSYHNLGVLYIKTRRYVEAEEFCTKAVDMYERLTKRSPDTYEPILASCYNNLSSLYMDIQRYAEAENLIIKAVDIDKRLAELNPDAHEPKLALHYNNLGILYQYTQRYDEAEEFFIKALETYERLAKRHPDAYEPNLASCYNNLGILYWAIQRNVESEDFYCKALEIRERLADKNPDAHEPDLAMSYNNLDQSSHKVQFRVSYT